MPLRPNIDAIFLVGIDIQPANLAGALQRKGKLPTYHNYTSSGMRPRAYHRVMVPAGHSRSSSMIVSFVSVGETLQNSHY